MFTTNRYCEAKKVTILGAIVNFLLGITKLIGGFLFNSHALIADAIHSFSDLFIDIMVVVASKYGSQDADASHPYGHQRIETAATFLLALLLILAGAGIAWDACYKIFATQSLPAWQALILAFASVIVNEFMFNYTLYIGNNIQSALIIANAWHHRSDSAASFVVLLGLIGSLLGYTFFDAVAAIIVGCFIIKMGLEYGWESIKELVDTAVPIEVLTEIEQLVHSIDGVLKIHQLRSRSMGADVYIDMHILVAPFISVSEGHFIAQQVQKKLITSLKSVQDVTVHIDPEDDEIACPSIHCTNRNELELHSLTKIKKNFPQLLFVNIHYLDGKMTIDLTLEKQFTEWNNLQEELKKVFIIEQNLIKIRLFTLVETLKKELSTC